MALRFAMSGGNFVYSQGPTVAGIWAEARGGLTNAAPVGRINTYAFTGAATSPQLDTPNLGAPSVSGGFSGLIAGVAYYFDGLGNNTVLIAFFDASGNSQCDVRMNGSGQYYFTRNGTVISGVSGVVAIQLTWAYFEFKALFSTSGAGVCELRVNGITILSVSNVTNATSGNVAAVVEFSGQYNSGSYATDFYVVDTVSGHNTSYLGDVSVIELFPDGPGVNDEWITNVGPSFSLSGVNGSGVYSGVITGGAGNAYLGYNFNITDFSNPANNLVGAACTASSATSLSFSAATVTQTQAASATFQCIVQPGINNDGTRPNQDVTYIASSTAGQISDFGHEPMNPLASGYFIAGVVHQSYMRKDDAGTRVVAQVCLSGPATEQSANESLGGSYQYWQDILEVDPNTSVQWGVSGLNAATFGVTEVS